MLGKMKLSASWIFAIAACAPWGLAGQDFKLGASPNPREAQWVDSVFNAMRPDQRLGQLFMIRAHSDKGPEHERQVEATIKKYQVGGLCFFQGTPERQVALVNRYQALADVPLLIGIDGEWGLGMRMKESTISFPRQLTLGAIQNNRLIYDLGAEIARQMRRVGVTVNFAPVVDINNNRENPVINTRSFGEDRYNVTVKGYMYMKGMQDNGVLACAKHFPGHGDTDVDSHYDLPLIRHDRQRLDSIELYPFRALSDYGVGSFMVAHLQMPSLETRPNRPTTLSENTVTRLLIEELGFQGLIFTDGLEMKGVTKYFSNGAVEAEALLAGNDILLLPEDIDASMREIKKYLADGRLSQAALDERVKKILRAKYRLGLTYFTPLRVDKAREDLNSAAAMTLKRRLYAEALTLVRDDERTLPLGGLDSLRVASLSIGASAKTPFQRKLDDYGKIDHYQAGKDLAEKDALRKYDIVIVSLHDMSAFASRGYGISAASRRLIEGLNQHTKVILVLFGTPYALHYFDDLDRVLVAYEEDSMAQDMAAQALFGAIPLRGRLPVTASPRSAFNMGVMTKPNLSLGFATPQENGLHPDTLLRIERLANRAIELGATPGCVVLAAKDGRIVYHQAFGYHAYDKKRPAAPDDVYDLASITKIAAATLAVMKLYEEGQVDLDAPIGQYLPMLAGSNKADLTLRAILAHRARLQNWIPFYKSTITASRRDPRPRPDLYRTRAEGAFQIPVTEKLFLREDYVDKIWRRIIDSELRVQGGYHYSDLGFYLIRAMVESLSGLPFDEYVRKHFYQPLGLRDMTFRPWQSIPLERIPPTEEDRYFRRQRVHGYVHDMGAAMLGGVSGHAGLFGNARELAVIMQMLLQGGYYGGRRYFEESTVKLFATRHPESTRRGLGFDMFAAHPSTRSNMSARASHATFGHTGFTGSCVWADPENQLVFVFLANRTYPSMNNYKLSRMETRERIQTALYEAIMMNDESGGAPVAAGQYPAEPRLTQYDKEEKAGAGGAQ
jgi:beta-N-acetylhexosaminidase